MYVAVGLGVLTKGPVAIALPVLVFGLYLLVHRELRRLRSMMLPLGAVDRRGDRRAVVRRALPAPRLGAASAEFIFGENVARYTAGLGVDSARGPLFYLPVCSAIRFPGRCSW